MLDVLDVEAMSVDFRKYEQRDVTIKKGRSEQRRRGRAEKKRTSGEVIVKSRSKASGDARDSEMRSKARISWVENQEPKDSRRRTDFEF
jgi:hypothetical protein